jgi:hypothetical protein
MKSSKIFSKKITMLLFTVSISVVKNYALTPSLSQLFYPNISIRDEYMPEVMAENGAYNTLQANRNYLQNS